ncbi:RNA polymerase II-associated protein [Cyathus striatus]|nr:RNA polymerase II-associated protein [Cyathus striatus]
MSFKKSKLDLLVRVRYSNPLPAPPCPPKLLDIPTNPLRYAQPEFLDTVADETPLPMIVDAECGMPWTLESGSRCGKRMPMIQVSLNPDPRNLPVLDPADAALLAEPSTSTGPYTTNGHAATSNNTPARQVTWLRKTEYLSRAESQKNSQEPAHIINQQIDVSRNAQLRDIEASFAACNDEFNLATLRHPTKPHLTAIESYSVLPDADIWANQYDLFRFSERPGEKPLDVEDPRLDCAILRPMKTEHDSFLAYYLTQDDESAMKFKELRSSLAPYEVPEDEEDTLFHFVRDYETVKVEQEVPNEFVLVIEDGDEEQSFEDLLDDSKPSQRKEKGAYYKNIERKMHLKKKRANIYDQYDDKWEIIRVQHAPMSAEEEDERKDALAEVMDPMYLIGKEEPDADGEIDEMAIQNAEYNGSITVG